MDGFALLSTLTFLPLLGVAFIMLFVHGDDEQVHHQSRAVALWISTGIFLLSLLLLFQFDPDDPGFQFVEYAEWFEGLGISYHLGVDGISVFFVVLTALLTPICILASWNSIKTQVREYMMLFLLLESLVIGVFVALDFVLFYFFFEASLIPMFFIIGVWGGENRIYAAFKFFLYTLLGSVLLLLAMIYMYREVGTTNIITLHEIVPTFSLEVQKWLWLALFASFAVKVPMWPVHTWLPDAHVQAPTAGSVMLAGVLLKLGAYGLIRFSLPMLPDASVYFTPLVFTLSLIAIVYTSLVALMQKDMKKLIAYSSVAHMGYVTMGLFALNPQGVEGAIFQMLSHGLVSAALFLCVGVLYERAHTKEIARYGGLVHRMPKFAMVFLLFTMASVGLPATSGFVGEFLTMLGAFRTNTWVGLISASGVVLGAAYMLWLYKRVALGQLTHDHLAEIKDVNCIEYGVFVVLALLTVLLGIMPNLVLDPMHASVENLLIMVGGSQ